MDNQPGHCKNCNQKLSGKYCSNCGQADFKRFSILYLWQLLHQDLFEIDRGLWKTFKDLMVRPGYMVKDFLAGKTKTYFSPLKYLLIAVALFYLLLSIEPLLEKGEPDSMVFEWKQEYLINNHSPFSGEAMQDFFHAISALLNKGLTLYFLLFIPFLSLGSLLIFKRYNFTEYLITLTFIWGHTTILMSVAIAITYFAKIFTSSESIFTALVCVLSVLILFLWVKLFKQLHESGWIKSFLKLLLVFYGSLIPFYAVLIISFMILKAILT
jgi:hypothetical protein